MIYQNILDAMGHTPMVQLNHMVPEGAARILVKYEGLNEIKPQMIEEATKNAREVAEKFAKDSDSKIGKIKSANQGTFSIEARDSNTPYIKRVRVVTSVTYYLNN